jgi:hypothetical protein
VPGRKDTKNSKNVLEDPELEQALTVPSCSPWSTDLAFAKAASQHRQIAGSFRHCLAQAP